MGSFLITPQASDWDRFWQSSQEDKKISWSKRRILRLLEPLLAGRKTALDAGSGSGFFANYFCQKSLKTTAVDYSQQALAMTIEKTQGKAQVLKCDLLCDDLLQKPFEKFDIIFSDGLFEHFSLSDQNKIMQNFISVLSDRGVIVTVVPNRFSPWEIIRPFFMPGIEEKPFVLSQLIKLNQDNGLSVLQSGGLNTFPFAFSPDQLFGRFFGMLLFTIAQKNAR